MVAGVHFPLSTSPTDIGYKALAVNLSDLAAMGASPLGAKIALVQQNSDRQWREAFDAGFAELATAFSLSSDVVCCLSGELVVTVQVYGEVPDNGAITRAGASAGDTIMVTGTLGDAGAGLACELGQLSLAKSEHEFALSRLNRPTARVREGRLLQGIASAAIDISDGLLADLGHLANASGLGANLDVDRLPLSAALRDSVSSRQSTRYALSAGDDYELLFTCAPLDADRLRNAILALGTSCTAIGSMQTARGIRASGDELASLALDGWEHFR